VILAGSVVVAPNALAIRCSGLVVLAQSARVIGHIQCRSIAIYEGARVVGTVQSFTE
jgi:cytoskeletal protein CcmA (bactofilin family)